MSNSVKTKRSLLSSISVLLLCFCMLISTTFAWFSDQSSTRVHSIVSGNLDIEMYWTDDLNSGKWYNVEDEGYDVIFDYDMWEPGYTEYRYIKLVNAGNLALNYHLALSSVGKVGELADVIQVYFANEALDIQERSDIQKLNCLGFLTNVMNGEKTAEGTLLAANQTSPLHPSGEIVMTLALSMITTAGNGYQNKSIGDGFTITALATQCAFESDSYGTSYDNGAEYSSANSIEKATASVTPVDSKVPEGGVTLSNGSVSAIVPEGVLLDENTNELTLTVTYLDDSKSNISVVNNEVLIPVDVHIDGVSNDNTVPIIISLGSVLPKYLNMGNYHLYHIENGTNATMSYVSSREELNAHNQFTYNSDTGEVTVSLASFSEVALIADTGNPWSGDYNNADTEFKGSGTESDPYLITTADELAGMSVLISDNPDNWGDKCYKLICDINIDGENGKVWYPIGYRKEGSGTNKAGETWYTYGGAFSGVFDGGGHTVTGILQNTWILDGNYGNGYFKEAMGLFGHVDGGTIQNLTVDNFLGEGEFTPMGCVAASASGNAKFMNIALTNCLAATYNTSVAGIVGWDCGDDSHLTFQNITIDSTNTISALWKTWDGMVGGMLGYLGECGSVDMENCVLAPTIDVYNDVCGNYQYYRYRYSGMVIGTVDRLDDDNTPALSDNRGTVTAKNCTVDFGKRHEYYYCEFEKNGKASYSNDYKFSRISNDELKYDENGNVLGCTHNHTEAEDKQAVYIPFRNLFGGHGWGIKSVDAYENIDITTLGENVEKFKIKEGISENTILRVGNSNAFQVGALFEAIDSVDINKSGVYVSVTSAIDGTEITGTFTLNSSDWTKSTLKLSGTGIAKITIQDYNLCTPTTMYVEVVDAYNVTDASGLGNKNMTLLNDVTFAKNFDLAGNNTLYGNGFTLDCSGYTPNAGRFGVIILNNGNLDNVRIIGQPFATFTNTSSEQYYAATVHVYGTSKISNSYIANCQVPVRVAAGADCTIDNTTLYGGRYANMEIKGGNVTLKDVTTVQEKVTIGGTTCLGMGIMIWQDTDSLTLKVDGTLTQYNWACEADKNYLPSTASNYASKVFSDSTFANIRHTYNGTDYVNFGIFNLSSKIGTDALSDMPSDYAQVTYSSAWIATYDKTKNSSVLSNGVPEYSDTGDSEQGIIAPTFTWNYPEDYLAQSNTIMATFEQGNSYTFNPNFLTAKKYGITLPIQVLVDGKDYTGKELVLTESGSHTIQFVVTDDYNYADGGVLSSITYEFTVKIIATATKPDVAHTDFVYSNSEKGKLVEINGKYYIMPDVSETSDTITSATVDGETVYMPIVEVRMKKGSGQYDLYAPAFSWITITDPNGTVYNTTSTSLPDKFGYTSGSAYYNGAGSTAIKSYNDYGVCYYSAKKDSTYKEQYQTVCFYYIDSEGRTYNYYVQYHFPEKTNESCITPDTLITLADGTQKRIDELTFDDKILAWDFFTASYVEKDISILVNHGADNYDVVYSTYSDGTILKTIGEHGVFDYDLNQFIYLTADNASEYIGHRFVKQNLEGGYDVVTMTECYVNNEYVEAWSLSSAETSNAFASGLLTVAPPEDFYNWIAMDGKLHYNVGQFAKDVESYGLYTYDDFKDYVTYEQFVNWNGAYLKIPVEKGYFTFEYILELIEMYKGWMS